MSANFALTEFYEVHEFGVSRKFVSKVSRTIHFGGCPVRSGGVTLGATTPVGKEENAMKAMVRDTYGPPDLLELRDIDIPEIADDEVLIHVHAAGVGRDVWHVMRGLPYPIRLAGYGFRAPKNPVIGSDVAGVVEAGGENVSRVPPRDEVFGIGKGSYAEYVCAGEDKLAPKPVNLTFEQAAG